MADGNKRYLGDVFINEENAERQERFLRDIVESYQYSLGGDFDAATLQGKGLDYFATREQGEKAENALYSPLKLGKTDLINIEDPQYIYTDSIFLDRDDGRLDLISWYTDLHDDNVTDALYSIYDNVIFIQNSLQDDIDSKADSSRVTTIEDALSEFLIENEDQNIDANYIINATLVNGLRFIPISSEAYSELSSADKSYWRNVFIVNDNLPADYENSLLGLNLTAGYEFRINNGYLQFTNDFSSEWKNICTVDTLLEGADFFSIIEDNQEYIINGTSLLKSIKELSGSTIETNWNNYPFLSSTLHDDFVYDIKMNGSKQYITDTVTDNFKNVDIDLNQLIQNNDTIGNISTTLTNQAESLGTINSTLSEVQSNIQTLQGDVTGLDSINSTLTSLQNSIGTINTNISNLNTKINNLSTYTKYTGSFINSSSDIFYNDYTKIAYVQIQMSYNHKGAKNRDWVQIGTLPSKFTPIQGFKVPHSPLVIIYFKSDRTVYCRVDIDHDSSFNLMGGGTFCYR